MYLKHWITLGTIAALCLISTDSAAVQSMSKSHLNGQMEHKLLRDILQKTLNDVSSYKGLSCYTTVGPNDVVPMECDSSAPLCGILKFVVGSAESSQLYISYSCASKYACDNPKEVCDEIAKNFTKPITNCFVTCCDGNNCNKPPSEEVKLIQSEFAVGSVEETSCYVTQSDGSTVKQQSCTNENPECGVVNFDAQIPVRSDNTHITIYLCANNAACENSELFCKYLAQQLPYQISNCSLKCCSGNNCNKPTVGKVKGQDTALPIHLPKSLMMSSNSLSCNVVQPDHSIVSQTCPEENARCLKVTADVQPAGEPEERLESLACATEKMCSNTTMVCNEIKIEIGQPISNCVVTCCNTDNCNTQATQTDKQQRKKMLFN